MSDTTETKDRVRLLSRPKDRTLEAYKDWILAMTAKINPGADNSGITEEKWQQLHAEFWGKQPEEQPAE